MTTNTQHPVVHFRIGCVNQPGNQNVFGWQPNAAGIINLSNSRHFAWVKDNGDNLLGWVTPAAA